MNSYRRSGLAKIFIKFAGVYALTRGAIAQTNPPALPTPALSPQTSSAKSLSDQRRQSRDRDYNLSTGELGNLRRLTLRLTNASVLITQGPQNKLLRGSQTVRVVNERLSKTDAAMFPLPRDLVLDTPESNDKPQGKPGAWIHLQVATLEDLYIAGEGLYVLIDQWQLPLLDVSMHNQQLAIRNISCQELKLNINGRGTVAVTGAVNKFQVESAQKESQVFAQNLRAKTIDIQPTSSGQFVAVNVETADQAHYYNPASTPRELVDWYPIELVGDANKLRFTGPGGAKISRLSRASIERASAIFDTIEKKLSTALSR